LLYGDLGPEKRGEAEPLLVFSSQQRLEEYPANWAKPSLNLL